MFPKVTGYVEKKNLCLRSEHPKNKKLIPIIVDTGFSGSIVLDGTVINQIAKDYLGRDTVTLAGGIGYSLNVYLCRIVVDKKMLNEIEVLEMKNESLIGISLMRLICKRAVFSFDKDKVLFQS